MIAWPSLFQNWSQKCSINAKTFWVPGLSTWRHRGHCPGPTELCRVMSWPDSLSVIIFVVGQRQNSPSLQPFLIPHIAVEVREDLLTELSHALLLISLVYHRAQVFWQLDDVLATDHRGSTIPETDELLVKLLQPNITTGMDTNVLSHPEHLEVMPQEGPVDAGVYCASPACSRDHWKTLPEVP